MHSGRDILKFNKYDEPPRYPIDTTKIKSFEDAIIVFSTIYDAINYTETQLEGTSMRVDDYHQEDDDMTTKKKTGMMGDERGLDVYPVDSSKINTIEDVRLVIDAMELAFSEGFSSYEKLKEYLSDVPLGYQMH